MLLLCSFPDANLACSTLPVEYDELFPRNLESDDNRLLYGT